MNHSYRLLTATALAGLCCSAFAQSSYDTETYWQTHEGTIGGVGAGTGNNLGQSFFAPMGGYDTLVDFSFLIRAYPGATGGPTASDTFQADIYQWSGTAPVGGSLETINLGTQTYSTAVMTQVNVNTHVAMTAGDEYLALLTDTSNQSDFFFGWVQPPAIPGDGGGNVVYNNGAWLNDIGDMAWHADFTRPGATPESFTVGLGIAGVALAVRRRAIAKARSVS